VRTIKKGREPPSLREHRNSGGRYETYTRTDDVRDALLRDQGHICCYCMRRIALRSMKIEHWASQSEHADSTVDWTNLLGACPGGAGEPRAKQHCDTYRGKTPLTVNPLDRSQQCERLIRYLSNGEMRSQDRAIQRDIHETLNLNNEQLQRNRGAVLSALLDRLKRVEPRPGPWPSDMLERELEAWRRPNKEGQLREYCQVAIYLLEKKLKRKA